MTFKIVQLSWCWFCHNFFKSVIIKPSYLISCQHMKRNIDKKSWNFYRCSSKIEWVMKFWIICGSFFTNGVQRRLKVRFSPLTSLVAEGTWAMIQPRSSSCLSCGRLLYISEATKGTCFSFSLFFKKLSKYVRILLCMFCQFFLIWHCQFIPFPSFLQTQSGMFGTVNQDLQFEEIWFVLMWLSLFSGCYVWRNSQ